MKKHGVDSYYSCIVAIACCLISCLMNGIGRMSGLLLVGTMSLFNIGREQASLPFVLCMTTKYLAGPFAGLLARRIGIRPVVLIGCCCGIVGIGAGFFAQNILQITIFWGVLYGIGRGFSTCVLLQVVNLYFSKHVCKAYGILYAGSSLCGILFPPFVKHFLQIYGVSGTFLILSGILLHCLAAAILTKEPNFKSSYRKDSDKNIFDTNQLVKKTNVIGFSFMKIHDPALQNIEKSYINNFSATLSNINQSKDDLKSDKQLSPDETTDVKLQRFEAEPILDSLENCKCIASTLALPKFSLSSVGEFKKYCSNTVKTEIFTLECEKNQPHSMFSDDKNNKEISTPEESNNSSCLNDLSIFRDPLYISICICTGVVNVFFSITLTIIVDYGIDKGISVTNSTYLLMGFSIGDIISSIVLGWIIDFSGLPKSYFTGLGFLTYAGSYILLALSKSFPVAMIAVLMDGISVGAMNTALPGLITDNIDKEKQTVAMSSLGFLFVPMSFTISPLIGYFRDQSGSYDYLLYLMCATAASCCVLSLCMPRIAKCRTTK